MSYFDGDDVIGMLNKLYASEIVSAQQYWRHANDVTGIFSLQLQDMFNEHADEEMSHAKMLREQIHILGGALDNALESILENNFASEKDVMSSLVATVMLQQDLDGELEAIDAYKEAALKVVNTDPGTFHLLSEILNDEYEHANDLRNLLGQ